MRKSSPPDNPRRCRAVPRLPRAPIAAGLGALLTLLACSLFSSARQPPPLVFPTLRLTPETPSPSPVTPPPTGAAAGPAAGKIAFTCQIYRAQASDQVCIINADGSGFRRLTVENDKRHFYPSISPDGQSVVYVSNASGKKDAVGNVYYDVYEINLNSGETHQLTRELGIITAPEVSPDGTQIVFTNSDGPHEAIWLMGRDGSNPHRIFGSDTVSAWDPTWSPSGQQILFASRAAAGDIQLFTMNVDGSGVGQVSNIPNLRGRSDWSVRNQITTYSGEPWQREVYIFTPDNPAPTQVSPPGGNGQGPSFSPDGNWIAFTAYYDRFQDIDGCEIYIVRTDGTGLARLTDNRYCDWQPRWGP